MGDYQLNRLGEKTHTTQEYEVVFPDGSKKTFQLRDEYNTEEIASRHAQNALEDWQFEQALAYEEKHYGVAIKYYCDGVVTEEYWAENFEDARILAMENIAHSHQCHYTELGHKVEYFGIYPRIYTRKPTAYFQFERGEYREAA